MHSTEDEHTKCQSVSQFSSLPFVLLKMYRLQAFIKQTITNKGINLLRTGVLDKSFYNVVVNLRCCYWKCTRTNNLGGP